MRIYGEWRKIDSLCVICAVPLESRPVWGVQHIVINGSEPMEYRHVEPHSCKNPEVYSCWNKYQEWLTSRSSGPQKDAAS